MPAAPFPDGSSTFMDPSVRVFLPEGYRERGSEDFVLHFHGFDTTVADTLAGHLYEGHVYASGANVVLVVPQGPVNASSGDFGKLMKPGGLLHLEEEVLVLLCPATGSIQFPIAGDLGPLTSHSGRLQRSGREPSHGIGDPGGATDRSLRFDLRLRLRVRSVRPSRGDPSVGLHVERRERSRTTKMSRLGSRATKSRRRRADTQKALLGDRRRSSSSPTRATTDRRASTAPTVKRFGGRRSTRVTGHASRFERPSPTARTRRSRGSLPPTKISPASTSRRRRTVRRGRPRRPPRPTRPARRSRSLPARGCA